MPYQNLWLIEDRVIIEKAWGIFTDEDGKNVDQELIAMMDASSAPKVHFVLDVTGVETRMTVAGVRQLNIPNHPKFGWFIIYGVQNSLIRSLVLLTALVFNLNFRIVKDHNQAMAFLEGLDALIPK